MCRVFPGDRSPSSSPAAKPGTQQAPDVAPSRVCWAHRAVLGHAWYTPPSSIEVSGKVG